MTSFSRKMSPAPAGECEGLSSSVPFLQLERISVADAPHVTRCIRIPFCTSSSSSQDGGGGGISIGRQGDRVIDSTRDPGSISRRHAIVRVDQSSLSNQNHNQTQKPQARLFVENRGSNGMLLDGAVLSRGSTAVMRVGQTLTFGLVPSELTFRLTLASSASCAISSPSPQLGRRSPSAASSCSASPSPAAAAGGGAAAASSSSSSSASHAAEIATPIRNNQQQNQQFEDENIHSAIAFYPSPSSSPSADAFSAAPRRAYCNQRSSKQHVERSTPPLAPPPPPPFSASSFAAPFHRLRAASSSPSPFSAATAAAALAGAGACCSSPHLLNAPPPSPASPFSPTTATPRVTTSSPSPTHGQQHNRRHVDPAAVAVLVASSTTNNNTTASSSSSSSTAAATESDGGAHVVEVHDVACQSSTRTDSTTVNGEKTNKENQVQVQQQQQQQQLQRTQLSLSMLVTDGSFHSPQLVDTASNSFDGVAGAAVGGGGGGGAFSSSSSSSIDALITRNGLRNLSGEAGGGAASLSKPTHLQQKNQQNQQLVATSSLEDAKYQVASQLVQLLLAIYDRDADTFAYTAQTRQQVKFSLMILCTRVGELHSNNNRNKNKSNNNTNNNKANSSFSSSSTLCPSVAAPCFVFGDLHGSFRDLLFVYSNVLAPLGSIAFCASNAVFLGDYVDRGSHSVEVIAMLFALKVLSPSKITLLRGNHESPEVNGDANLYGDACFLRQICERLCSGNEAEGTAIWETVNGTFAQLPLAAVIAGDVFATHAGIPQAALLSDEEFRAKFNYNTNNNNNKSKTSVSSSAAAAAAEAANGPASYFSASSSSSSSSSLTRSEFLDALLSTQSPLRFSRLMPEASDSPRTSFRREMARELLWNDPAATSSSFSRANENEENDDNNNNANSLYSFDAYGFRANASRGGLVTIPPHAQEQQEQDEDGEESQTDVHHHGGQTNNSVVVVREFSQEALERFLTRHGFSFLLRAHQVKSNGLQVAHDLRIITVFSASDYRGQAGSSNTAGGVLIDLSRKLRLFTWLLPARRVVSSSNSSSSSTSSTSSLQLELDHREQQPQEHQQQQQQQQQHHHQQFHQQEENDTAAPSGFSASSSAVFVTCSELDASDSAYEGDTDGDGAILTVSSANVG